MLIAKKEIRAKLYDSSIEKSYYSVGLKQITAFYVEMNSELGKAVGAGPIDDGKYRDGNYLALIEMENPASREISSLSRGTIGYESLYQKIEVVTHALNGELVTRPLNCDTKEGRAFVKALENYVKENSQAIFGKEQSINEISVDDEIER